MTRSLSRKSISPFVTLPGETSRHERFRVSSPSHHVNFSRNKLINLIKLSSRASNLLPTTFLFLSLVLSYVRRRAIINLGSIPINYGTIHLRSTKEQGFCHLFAPSSPPRCLTLARASLSLSFSAAFNCYCTISITLYIICSIIVVQHITNSTYN